MRDFEQRSCYIDDVIGIHPVNSPSFLESTGHSEPWIPIKHDRPSEEIEPRVLPTSAPDHTKSRFFEEGSHSSGAWPLQIFLNITPESCSPEIVPPTNNKLPPIGGYTLTRILGTHCPRLVVALYAL